MTITGWKALTAKSDWVQLVLLEDLGSDKWDGVWLNPGVPIRWELLLAEEIVHGDKIRLALVPETRKQFATRQSGAVNLLLSRATYYRKDAAPYKSNDFGPK